jgi:LysM repeat protein
MTRIYNNSTFTNKNRVKSRRNNNFKRRKIRAPRVGLPMQVGTFFSKFQSLNKFYFQIIGIGMLTFAIVLAFYSFVSLTTTGAEASTKSENIRILTNFQKNQDDYSRSSSAKLIEISTPANQPEENQISSSKTEKATLTIETKPSEKTTQQPVYIVLQDDTLYKISQATSKPIESIAQLNKLTPPYNLSIGQEILLP